MKKKLKIIITADPEIPVPPKYYGGIERIIDLLVKGLKKRGHKVYLFAHPESKTSAELIAYQGQRSSFFPDTLKNAVQIKKYFNKIGNIDIVHSFSRLAYLLFLAKTPTAKIQSYQRKITLRSIKLGSLLIGSNLSFTSLSQFCINPLGEYSNKFKVIPNGVEVEKYRFIPEVSSDAPFVFLGRVEEIKGPHIAIKVAKISGKKLIIAGNHAKRGKDWDYFKKDILSQCDGENIKYIGPVNDTQKSQLLGQASALLFPIQWDEPFGIVITEALACGTPVIALRRGAVPEVIQHKQTGFICDSTAQMAEAVKSIDLIKRINCRQQLEKRFSNVVIVDKYEELYYECIKS